MSYQTAEEIEKSTEKLMHDLQEVVRDGEALLEAGASHLGERGAAARERLAAAVEVAKETRRKLEQQARAGLERTDTLIRENPYQSLAAGFGVGMLLGLILSRK